jgi:hypothetical protein
MIAAARVGGRRRHDEISTSRGDRPVRFLAGGGCSSHSDGDLWRVVRHSIDAGLELLNGRPHWRIFQNRVLGPFVARALMRVAPSPDIGYLTFQLTGIAGGLILAWFTGFRVAVSITAALASMPTLAFGLASLFSGDWFHPWDVAGLPIFMDFAWLVAARANLFWIVALFAVAIWNRDDALFIALFLVVEPIVNWYRSRNAPARVRLDWRSVTLGFACVIAGVLLIMTLRHFLLIEELGLRYWGQPRDTNTFFRWTLVFNVEYFWSDLSLTALDAPGLRGFAATGRVRILFLAYVRQWRPVSRLRAQQSCSDRGDVRVWTYPGDPDLDGRVADRRVGCRRRPRRAPPDASRKPLLALTPGRHRGFFHAGQDRKCT